MKILFIADEKQRLSRTTMGYAPRVSRKLIGIEIMGYTDRSFTQLVFHGGGDGHGPPVRPYVRRAVTRVEKAEHILNIPLG